MTFLSIRMCVLENETRKDGKVLIFLLQARYLTIETTQSPSSVAWLKIEVESYD